MADALPRALSKVRRNTAQREGCRSRALERKEWQREAERAVGPDGGTQGTSARRGDLLGGKEASCPFCRGNSGAVEKGALGSVMSLESVPPWNRSVRPYVEMRSSQVWLAGCGRALTRWLHDRHPYKKGQRHKRPHAEGGRPHEDGGRDRSDVSASQGWPATPRSWEEAGRTLLGLPREPRPAYTWISDLRSPDLWDDKCLPFRAHAVRELVTAATGSCSKASTCRAENWDRETEPDHGHFLSQEHGAKGRSRQFSGPSFQRHFFKKLSFVFFRIFLFGLLSYCCCLWTSRTWGPGAWAVDQPHLAVQPCSAAYCLCNGPNVPDLKMGSTISPS